MSEARDLTALCDRVTAEVHALTGFDRVMICRFDEEWNGSVVAETVSANVEGFFGQHFPASDIPPQARALFLTTSLRTIPDATHTPAPLIPVSDPMGPIDLTRAALRSASPLHLEYLRNMGVGASLTVSLERGGKLWGLIACHHRIPKLVPHEVRRACALVGRLASSLLAAKEENEDLEDKRHLKAVHAKLLAFMADSDDLVSGLVKNAPNLLDLTAATGAAAAIYFGNEWTVIGNVPPIEDVSALADWLSTAHPALEVFSTNALPSLYPPAAKYKDVATGLLALSIPKSAKNYILWFRPEVVRDVHWAGEPEKSVQGEGAALRVHPRASFDLWTQVVHERSVAWKPSEIEAAVELRKAIIEIDLERQFRSEQVARAAAELAIQGRDHVLAVVSHDLKNPLGVISVCAQTLAVSQANSPRCYQRSSAPAAGWTASSKTC